MASTRTRLPALEAACDVCRHAVHHGRIAWRLQGVFSALCALVRRPRDGGVGHEDVR